MPAAPSPSETSNTQSNIPLMHIRDVATVPFHQLVLHRCRVTQELIHIFKDPEIVSYSLHFKFQGEYADDAVGVSRDAYAEFRQTFLLSLYECGVERVRLLCTNSGDEDWQVLGRI